MFEPKDGIAEWQKIYEMLPREVDAVVKYPDLDAALDRDFRSSRGPLYSAMRALEENDHRTLSVVRGVGYRIAKPVEHETLGRLHHRKGVRSLRRSKGKFASADRSLLSAEAAARMDAMQAKMDEMEQHIRHLRYRADRQEAAHASVVTKVDVSNAEFAAKIAAMEETLRRHGMLDW